MKRLSGICALVTVLMVICAALIVRNNETYSDIAKHLFYDLSEIPKGDTLLVGSSSIKRLQGTPFSCSNWLNRGIGSATITDLKRYVTLTTLPNNISHIIIYAGENDLATESISENTVISTFAAYQELILMLHSNWPTASIELLAIKLSPKRDASKDLFTSLNRALDEWTEKVPYASFTDHILASTTINFSGFYLADGIHLNNTGYSQLLKGLSAPCKRP